MAHPLCPTPRFPFFFLPFFYTSHPLFNTSPLFFLHTFLICYFFFLSLLSPSFSPLLLLLAFFSLCLSPLSSFSSFEINHFLFQRTSHFLFQRTSHFLLFEGIACTVLIEGIACTVCFEGIACTVCIEGIACTVCFEGIACTVCM